MKTLGAIAATLATAFALGASGLPGWLVDAALAQWGAPALLAPYL
jgi:hypothetical protein